MGTIDINLPIFYINLYLYLFFSIPGLTIVKKGKNFYFNYLSTSPLTLK